MTHALSIIGLGNMGGAILRGILNEKYLPQSCLYVYDKDSGKTEALLREYPGIHACDSAEEAAEASEFVLLAVKPQFLGDLLAELRDSLEDRAVISIAAGWTVRMLSDALEGTGAVWLRVMPNTPALVGEGMTALCSETNFDPGQMAFAKGIFEALGRTVTVPERLFDGVVAISGSSPAYCFMMLEAMADGGVREGIPRQTAIEMAAQAMLGSALMVLQTGSHPAQLKDAVCSPAGTTIEAVAKLEEGGFRSAILEAMRACAEKSAQMGR